MEYQENPQTSVSLPLSAQEAALLQGFRQLDEQAQQDVVDLALSSDGGGDDEDIGDGGSLGSFGGSFVFAAVTHTFSTLPLFS